MGILDTIWDFLKWAFDIVLGFFNLIFSLIYWLVLSIPALFIFIVDWVVCWSGKIWDFGVDLVNNFTDYALIFLSHFATAFMTFTIIMLDTIFSFLYDKFIAGIYENFAFPDEIAGLVSALGLDTALVFIGSAIMVRFILQSIPFVRWGS